MQENQIIYGQEQSNYRQNDKQNNLKQDNREKEVMEVSLQAGHLLLENGAEISRVEETIERICRYYGVCSGNAFVLTNGIFVTVGSQNEPDFAKVEHIPVSGTHLDRVAAVNQLSREIEAGMYTVREVAERLECIKRMPGKPKYMQVLASGCGCAAFCYLFGGSIWDSAVALLTGIILYIYVLYVSAPHLSKIVGNISGGALVTILCSAMYLAGMGQHLNYMVIGSIMPLIPGVPFTNTIREIADSDYISGSVRMMDALLIFFCIAIGVGVGFSLAGWVTGGTLL